MAHPRSERPRGPTSDLSAIVAFTVTITHPATGVTLVDPAGELDLWTSATLDEHLEREVRDPYHRHVVVNLSHLSFCGVAGCGSLLRARERAHEQRSGLYLVPGSAAGRVLYLTGLHDRFRTYPDLTSALAAVSSEVRMSFLGLVPGPNSARPERVAT